MIQYVVGILELALYIAMIVAAIVTVANEIVNTVKEMMGWK